MAVGLLQHGLSHVGARGAVAAGRRAPGSPRLVSNLPDSTLEP